MSILVIGEALIDIVTTPGAPDRYAPGGAPANVALGLGRLGEEVELLTDVGDDFHGGFLLAHLRASNVQVHATPKGATSTARATLAADGSADYDFRLRWSPDGSLVVDRSFSALHIGSIAAFLAPGSAVVDTLLDTASAQGSSSGTTPLTTFDPNIRPSIIGSHAESRERFEALAARVDVVKLSDVDADWLYPGEPAKAQLDRILGLGAGLVAMTRGGEGALLSTASARSRIAAEIAEVTDTIGAGDSFMVSLVRDLHRLSTPIADLHAEQLTEIGQNAAHLAAVTVARTGADLPWSSEL